MMQGRDIVTMKQLSFL